MHVRVQTPALLPETERQHQWVHTLGWDEQQAPERELDVLLLADAKQQAWGQRPVASKSA